MHLGLGVAVFTGSRARRFGMPDLSEQVTFLLVTTMTSVYQDPPCTLNWGYMVPNSRYLGPIIKGRRRV